MRNLEVFPSDEHLTPDILLVLQLHTVSGHLLPRLNTFECEDATEAFIPFVLLLLSPKTIEINITFTGNSPAVVIVSMVNRFSTLCPHLEYITLRTLPRSSVIIDAVSQLLLACDRDTLQGFQVYSPLTEEAREVVYQLPRPSSLWAVIQGPASLPTIELPNLTSIDVEYDDHLDWLQRFRGATLGRLEVARFIFESNQIVGLLGAFESVALTASAQNTLSTLAFYACLSRNPNYSSLLSFKHLRELEIEFSCCGGCSSMVDDYTINLAQAMPEMEVLRLSKTPCHTPTGITVSGLIGLASPSFVPIFKSLASSTHEHPLGSIMNKLVGGGIVFWRISRLGKSPSRGRRL